MGVLGERRGGRVVTVHNLVAAEATFLLDDEWARNDKPFFLETPIYILSLQTWALLIAVLVFLLYTR